MSALSNKHCPICNSGLTIKSSSICDGHGQTTVYYTVYCGICGYGPVNAYFTAEDAVDHLENIKPSRPPAAPNYQYM